MGAVSCRIENGAIGWLFILCWIPGLVMGQGPHGVDVIATENGTMEIHVEAKEEHYYILYRGLKLEDVGEVAAMALGKDGTVTMRDRFATNAPQVFYRVREVAHQDSDDVDGDGRSDINELRENIFSPGTSNGNALNPFDKIRGRDGTYYLTAELFDDYSIQGGRGVTPGITGERFMKFVGLPEHDPSPAILFMNTRIHRGHGGFLGVLQEKMNYFPSIVYRGEMAWIPDAEGVGPGWYIYNLQPGDLPSFEDIRLIYQLLTKNMAVIDGNLAYRPWDTSLAHYLVSADLRNRLEAEGIPVWLDPALESAGEPVNYAALNQGEAFGLLRVFESDERPSLLDIALFRNVPNDVPLVRGIITEKPQTPLSHVNLRAVQNQNPNAFIAGASSHPEIEPLIGRYVRFAVRPDGFEIEEVTREEVETRLEALRPTEIQEPRRNTLWNKFIQPLENLGFEDSSSIGAKAANLAELISSTKSIGIPREVYPAFGHAIPFYFYDEFMKHNDFYRAAERMMAEDGFAEDPAIREKALSDFRKRIRKAGMPQWMLDQLEEVQGEFAEVGGIRCRSSTNNEDLPGFNGAGLYESYTHYPDEGHLAKSVKQVFAGMWTFIAFEHREFYRVDHFKAAMGVLMHPNYQDEKANGVAVSRYDLIQIESHPFYANTQVGENLVTNPEIHSRPEEMLLPMGRISRGFSDAKPIRLVPSNQVPPGQHVLGDAHAALLGSYLDGITRHFGELYPRDPGFAMEVEFKVTSENQLIIKQARPWVH